MIFTPGLLGVSGMQDASVRRISDNEIFTIPLWDLKVVDNKNSNFQIVSDYSSWMTNYR
jgi:hypothetical protein